MRTMTKNERAHIEYVIKIIFSNAVSDEYVRILLEFDNIMEDIIDDVLTSSDWEDKGEYNVDDIRLAIGRTLMAKLNIEV